MKKTKNIYAGAPVRLDVYLAASGENFSRSYARRLAEEGLALVNGARRKPSFMLTHGDEVELALPGSGLAQEGFEKLVLFEDDALLAVQKPAGVAVHPNPGGWETNPRAALLGEPTLVSMLYTARPKTAEAGLERLGVVHRLDRDTSGLMLIAKTPEAQQSLKDGFRERLMRKVYLGAVAGIPPKTGVIDAPIGRASGFKKIKVWEYGRDALTEYALKEKGRGCALLEIYPKTGRTNQIRIHLAHIGHPIMGDKLYGGPDAPRMLLHSFSLAFAHPYTGRRMTLRAPLQPDFKAAWKEVSRK
ncbi:MAG: RluA family pseudouridine synthase [Elusimicrobia bacterium]|jgi:23S rRNA pseudouridine1911/1915/1917 synthase|nr:RluA family pseudouridine synthase [Elusimicrobiota bacterium]